MRLFWKIYLTYAAFLVASMVLLSLMFSRHEADHALFDLRKEQRLLAVMTALQVDVGYREKIWPFEMLASLASENNFVSWKILDGTGEVLFAEPKIDQATVPLPHLPDDQPRLAVDESAKTETWLVPMNVRTGKTPWQFHLTYSTRIVDRNVHKIQFANLLFALGIVVTLAPLSWILTRSLLRPLSLLTRAATRLGSGDSLQELQLPKAGNDEVGQLVRAFKDRYQDIADRDQRIQEQLDAIQQARDDLERRVEERTADLNESTKTLQATNKSLEKISADADAANRAKSEFLANMSHEIRTPMAAILGYVDILHDQCESEELQETLYTIKRNGLHLLDIINDILDLSKIESGKFLLENILCSPRVLLDEVESLMIVRAKEKDLKFRVEHDGPIPQFMRSDPTRLRQILINLISNAIKFTDAGKVRVVARLMRNDSDEPRLQIEVIDTGIGITTEQLDHLFDPFHQAEVSISRRYGGTGLGLTLSKRLAQMLGGDIDVRSIPGKGSTFTLTVATGPLDHTELLDDPFDSRPETVQAAQDPPRPTLRGSRMLLAEDGPDNQQLVVCILQREGVQVTVADNGQIAYELAISAHQTGEPFDIIIMDMQMPVLDGYQATRRLRAEGYTSPIIALTAHAMSHDRQKCLDAGCDDYLSKPVERRKLVTHLAHWLTNTAEEERSRFS